MVTLFISIIVPAYNIESYVARCIEGVIRQEFTNWELILIDDGSTDRTPMICKSYAKKDRRIKVFMQENSGVSYARNKGLREAVGEYIAFIDGDDYWNDTQFLNRIAQIAPADVIYNPNVILQYPNGAKRKELEFRHFSENDVKYNPALYLAQKMKNPRWGCVFFIIRKAIIDQAESRFNESIRIGEDADWVFRTIMCASNMKIIDNLNYVYCVNRAGSVMTQKSPDSVNSLFEMVKGWKEIYGKNPDMKPVYVMFCNNAMEYLCTFGIYKKDEQLKLFQALKDCGAYEHSDSMTAVKIKRNVEKIGFKRYISRMAKKHRIMLIGSTLKGKIMR